METLDGLARYQPMTDLQTDGAEVFSRWLNEGMTKRPRRPHDLNQWAKHMVDLATGNAPESDLRQGKIPEAVNLGRCGVKGGKARSSKMTPERRSEIAKKAAQARWGNER